jgi:hypothetical protein
MTNDFVLYCLNILINDMPIIERFDTLYSYSLIQLTNDVMCGPLEGLIMSPIMSFITSSENTEMDFPDLSFFLR